MGGMETNRRDFIGASLAFAAVAGCTAPRCGGERKCGTGRPFSFDSHCTLRMPMPGLKEPVNFFVVGDTHFGFHDARDDAYADN